MKIVCSLPGTDPSPVPESVSVMLFPPEEVTTSVPTSMFSPSAFASPMAPFEVSWRVPVVMILALLSPA